MNNDKIFGSHSYAAYSETGSNEYSNGGMFCCCWRPMVMSSIKSPSGTDHPDSMDDGGYIAVKGIRNLGNTCYLNSILQCLNQTFALREALENTCISSLSTSSINSTSRSLSKLGLCGKELCGLFKHIDSDKQRVVNPKQLLTEIRKKSEVFSGYRPQDSHEVFRTILDCIRIEEIDLRKRDIYHRYKCKPDASTHSQLDEEEKTLMKDQLKMASRERMFLDEVFGGEIVNTIVCRECRTVLQVHENWIDLSVPLVPNNQRKRNLSKCYSCSVSDPSAYGTPTEGYHQSVNSACSSYIDAPDVFYKPQSSINSLSHNSKTRSFPFMHKKKQEQKLCRSYTTNHPPMVKNLRCLADIDPDATVKTIKVENHEDSPTPSICSAESAASSLVAANSNGASNTVASSSDISTNEAQLQLYLKRHNLPHCFRRPPTVDTDLEAGISELFTLDVLDDDNKFICDTCTARKLKELGHPLNPDPHIGLCKVSKHLSINRLPKVLVLQIKRFRVHIDVKKCTELVTFPLVLDMEPYCTSECFESLKRAPKSPVWYGLYGIVEHKGRSLNGGHYISYVKQRNKHRKEFEPLSTSLLSSPDDCDGSLAEDGEWYCISDRHVKKLDGGFADVQHCEAYILFYELLPPKQNKPSTST